MPDTALGFCIPSGPHHERPYSIRSAADAAAAPSVLARYIPAGSAIPSASLPSQAAFPLLTESLRILAPEGAWIEMSPAAPRKAYPSGVRAYPSLRARACGPMAMGVIRHH